MCQDVIEIMSFSELDWVMRSDWILHFRTELTRFIKRFGVRKRGISNDSNYFGLSNLKDRVLNEGE